MLEFFEQTKQRMGVVLVGPPGSGKSTLWRVLQRALAKMGTPLPTYVMNPKAMPRSRLLGHIDMDTREWSDGVLTASARLVIKEPLSVTSWIICDGDIDPEWIESLNSVLDDNRLLTMPSGERIQFGPNVNFIFETHDLSSASPATISRMGMIAVSEEDLEPQAVVQAWLQKHSDNVQLSLQDWINDVFYKALEWVVNQGETVAPQSRLGIVLSGLSHLMQVVSKEGFVCGLVQGLGATLSLSSRVALAQEVFRWASVTPPDARRLLDVYCPNGSQFVLLTSVFPASWTLADLFNDPVVLTPDTQRTLLTIQPWLDQNTPFVLVGPEGCGKLNLLKHCFRRLKSTAVASMYCNAQTTPEDVQLKLSQSCMVLSTNNGRVYRPKDSERLILFLKDINLPKPDKWGTSPLVAFLQQLITYNGFHDSRLEWVGLENIQV